MKDLSFGNYICALRMSRGLSQFQLGTLVGVTDKAVSKWENGDAKPRHATCRRLAKALDVHISELLSCEEYFAKPARKELDKMNKQLWEQAYQRLYNIYGKNPPVQCLGRLASEESALQGTNAIQGFALLGKIAEEARKQNTAIIPAGTVNSSFAAWLFGGTKVNPLPPHYLCPVCGKTEFVPGTADAFDLEPKKCACGRALLREGHCIPYEGYAKMEKEGTVLEIRVSEGFRPAAVHALKSFYKDTAAVLPVKIQTEDPQISYERYMVLPKEESKPFVSSDGFWHTNMEEYRARRKRAITISFPSGAQLNRLQKMTERTRTSLPELQGLLTREMAERLYARRCEKAAFITDQIPPSERRDFDLLIRLDSMSHATGAWIDNGALLVQEGKARFREIPASREDIWNDISEALTENGIFDYGFALLVMENARMGQYFRKQMPEPIAALLRSLGLPDWYPQYLKKVQYLFPKGHCIAFLVVELMCEWYRKMDPEAAAQCEG